MQPQTLAHLSDLHFGRSDHSRRVAASICDELIRRQIDHVVLTGDVTHRGRASEYLSFIDTFAPLIAQGRLTVVPGNHDRLGDDVASWIMEGGLRVDVVRHRGLHLVRVDSTAPHNRFLIAGHGAVCARVIEACAAALRDAAPHTLRVVLLHHHVLPAPLESLSERLADFAALPFANELALGEQFLNRVRGLADLVLHGHRHVPTANRLDSGETARLDVYNAGSSTELGQIRLFTHASGALTKVPEWIRLKEVPDVDAFDHAALGVNARTSHFSRPTRRPRLASA